MSGIISTVVGRLRSTLLTLVAILFMLSCFQRSEQGVNLDVSRSFAKLEMTEVVTLCDAVDTNICVSSEFVTVEASGVIVGDETVLTAGHFCKKVMTSQRPGGQN